jgi:hypothetical protein
MAGSSLRVIPIVIVLIYAATIVILETRWRRLRHA